MTSKPKVISVVTPCFNEEENVEELHARIREVFAGLPNYDYQHLYIDNASTDRTVKRIKEIARHDRHVSLIVNTRNFGHIRSPIHGIFEARGDAIISMASDLQDLPEMIPEFIEKWEQGFQVVVGTKPVSEEQGLMSLIRRAYYRLVGSISEVTLIPQFTGFGLYDRKVITAIKEIDDPYPYFRGLIPELGFEYATIPFKQPRRKRGITKNNFYTLYDIAMLGITSHSKVPLRIATMSGFALSLVSLILSISYLVLKLLHWDQFGLGTAPILIGMFFFASVQLFFIGLLGEYVLSIHTQVHKRPLVMEKERINIDEQDSP